MTTEKQLKLTITHVIATCLLLTGNACVDSGNDDAGSENTDQNCDSENSYPHEMMPELVRGAYTIDSAVAPNDSTFFAIEIKHNASVQLGSSENNVMIPTAEHMQWIVAKFDETGEFQWYRPAPLMPDGTVGADILGLDVDSEGAVTLVGKLWKASTIGKGDNLVKLDPGEESAFYFAHYLPSGELEWAVVASGASNGTSLENFSIAPSGHLMLVGSFSYSHPVTLGTGDKVVELQYQQESGFVGWYDAQGSLLGASNGNDIATSSATSGVSVAGIAVNNITLGTGEQSIELSDAGSAFVFLARFALDGTVEWASKVAPASRLMGMGQISDGTSVVMGMTFKETITVGQGVDSKVLDFDSAYSNNFFIARYGAGGILEWAIKAQETDPAEYIDRFDFCEDGTIRLVNAGVTNFTLGEGEQFVEFEEKAGSTVIVQLGTDGQIEWAKQRHSGKVNTNSLCHNSAAFVHHSRGDLPIVEKIDDSGELLWATPVDPLGASQYVEYSEWITILSNGDVASFFPIKGISKEQAVVNVKLDRHGNEVWQKMVWGIDAPFDPPSEKITFEHLFHCPEVVCEPHDVSGYVYDDRIGEFFNELRSHAMAWIDNDCMIECDPAEGHDECIEANCETSAGAKVEYRVTVDSSFEGTVHTNETSKKRFEKIVVTPPAGQTWTRIELEFDSANWESTSDEWFRSKETSYKGSWEGILESTWPENHSFSAEYSVSNPNHWDDWTMSFENGQCDFESTASCENGDCEYTFEMGENTVTQSFNGNLFLNGECVGHALDDSWAIDGACQ